MPYNFLVFTILMPSYINSVPMKLWHIIMVAFITFMALMIVSRWKTFWENIEKWANLATIVAVLAAIVFGFINLQALIPDMRHGSTLAFSEDSINIKNHDRYDEIHASIRNIGDASATNIKFRIYVTFFKDTIDDSVVRLYDDYVINEAFPNSQSEIGLIPAQYNLETPDGWYDLY